LENTNLFVGIAIGQVVVVVSLSFYITILSLILLITSSSDKGFVSTKSGGAVRERDRHVGGKSGRVVYGERLPERNESAAPRTVSVMTMVMVTMVLSVVASNDGREAFWQGGKQTKWGKLSVRAKWMMGGARRRAEGRRSGYSRAEAMSLRLRGVIFESGARGLEWEARPSLVNEICSQGGHCQSLTWNK
jgi:hypothetical protein